MPTQATEAKTFDTLIPDAVPHIFPSNVLSKICLIQISQ